MHINNKLYMIRSEDREIDMWEKYRPGNPRFVRDPGFRGYELRFPTAPDEMGFLLPQP